MSRTPQSAGLGARVPPAMVKATFSFEDRPVVHNTELESSWNFGSQNPDAGPFISFQSCWPPLVPTGLKRNVEIQHQTNWFTESTTNISGFALKVQSHRSALVEQRPPFLLILEFSGEEPIQRTLSGAPFLLTGRLLKIERGKYCNRIPPFSNILILFFKFKPSRDWKTYDGHGFRDVTITIVTVRSSYHEIK